MSEILDMVQDCINRQEKLTDWEVNFIADISDRLDESKELTRKQEDKLFQIWGRVSKVLARL